MAEQLNQYMSGPANNAVLMVLLTLIVAGPVVTLIHELGHGLAALALTSDEVDVTVGPNHDIPPTLRRGRLVLRTAVTSSAFARLRAPAFARRPRVKSRGPAAAGTTRFRQEGLHPRAVVTIVLAGPAATCLAAFASALAARALQPPAALALWTFALMAFASALQSLMPRAGKSDGAVVLATLRAGRLVPGGATALSPAELRAVIHAVEVWRRAAVEDRATVTWMDTWLAFIWANDEILHTRDEMSRSAVFVLSGFVLRVREGVQPLPDRLAAVVARGGGDPVRALAVDAYASELAVTAAGAREAAAMRFHLLRAQNVKRGEERQMLHAFDVGRALADVHAAGADVAAAAAVPSGGV